MKFFKLFLIFLGIFNASSICHAGKKERTTKKPRALRKETVRKQPDTQRTKKDTAVKKDKLLINPTARITIGDNGATSENETHSAIFGINAAASSENESQATILSASREKPSAAEEVSDRSTQDFSRLPNDLIKNAITEIIDTSAVQLHESTDLNAEHLTNICNTNHTTIQEKIAAIMKDLSHAERCALAAELNNEHSWTKFFKDKINYTKESLPTKKQVAYSIVVAFIITTVILSSYAWITLGSEISLLNILEFNLATIKAGLVYTYTTVSTYLSDAFALIGSTITSGADAACKGYNEYVTAPTYLSQIQSIRAESQTHAQGVAACSYTLSKIQECLSTASNLSPLSSDGIYARMVPQYANALIGKCVQAVFSEIPTTQLPNNS